MTRVCQKWFPETDGFFMDEALKTNIDILLKNFDDDWSFSFIITAGGKVRIGKSVLGMQIACYVAYVMKDTYGHDTCFDIEKNFVFRGEELITKGHFLGQNHKYSPMDFDEAGGDLQAKKIMSGATQRVLDYFREAGQYNLFNIFVLPDFFDLPKNIAVNHTDVLLDVYYTVDEKERFQRGFFKFFSERSKKKLYINGKKFLDYNSQRADFVGRFYDFYPIPKERYKEMKMNALLSRDEERKTARNLDKQIRQRNAAFYILHKVCGYQQGQIAEMICDLIHEELPDSTLRDAIHSLEHGTMVIPVRPELIMPLPPIAVSRRKK